MKKEMKKEMKKGMFQKIYQLVIKIPKGRVVTYGEVANALGIRDVRIVGWALHGNKDLNTPCHRVVNKDGQLASNYAFFG